MNRTDADTVSSPARGRGRVDLQRIFGIVRGRIRLSRGTGGQALDAVLRKLHGTQPLDDDDEQRLARVVESLVFAVEDAEAAARRPRY